MFWYITICVLMIYPAVIEGIGISKGINTKRLSLIIASIILCFFMAFRGETVGADTRNYIGGFEQLANTPFYNLFDVNILSYRSSYDIGSSFEYGYRIYNKIISILLPNFFHGHAIIISNSIVTIFLLYHVIEKKSDYAMLSIWLYISLGIFQTQMNMSRNAMAIFWCYWAMKYIKTQELKKYFICVGIAILFHKSSILFLPLYFLVNYIAVTYKKIIQILVVSLIIGVNFAILRPVLYEIIPRQFKRYFYGTTTEYEGLLVGVFYLMVVIVAVLFVEKRNRKLIFTKCTIGTWNFIINIAFFCIGISLSSATRMAALFGPYMLIYIPQIISCIDSKNRKTSAIFMVSVLCGVQYFMRLMINNIGTTMPYCFMW